MQNFRLYLIKDKNNRKSFQLKKLKNLLVEENYNVVEKRLGVNLESCCICSNDYHPEDKVITLPCNNK